MKVRFTITMTDVVVMDQCINFLKFQWEDDVSQEQVLQLSHLWISTTNFLTQRMIGLTRVEESSLSIEPLEAPC